ncbi:MAG: DHH family phosphoesterase [Nanohaloarchaea archaeon]|nr:DHH family phosphoesterase [Candidatus Nanohaloarchaea archaeon]
MVEDILEECEPAVEKLENFEGKIRLVGQYDADGISATAIAHEMLDRMGKDFEYEILKQLYEEDVKRIAEEDEELILFVDIGSGQSEFVQEHIVEEAGKEVIVSDHHEPQIEGEFIHLNPHFLGHDGGEAISAAGMTYLLAEKASEENHELVEYALIGATGDVQKQDGEFMGLNKDLLERAEERELIEKRQGLDLYGRSTKPLHKSLMYTSDPHLEGITNNESGAIQFVKSCGVEIREDGDFRTLEDLSEEEEKKLISGMIKHGYPAQELMQNIYVLNNSHGIDEFSTIINACGRLGEPKTGVKILLEQDLELAGKISRKYSREISSALGYVEENKDDTEVIYEDGIGIIDGKDEVEDDFIGTVTTITMSNGFFSDVPVILGVAESEKDKIKASSRADKDAVENGLNLGEIIEEICEEIDGEGGGHNVAAGAKFPREKKEEFIEKVREGVLEEVSN